MVAFIIPAYARPGGWTWFVALMTTWYSQAVVILVVGDVFLCLTPGATTALLVSVTRPDGRKPVLLVTGEEFKLRRWRN